MPRDSPTVPKGKKCLLKVFTKINKYKFKKPQKADSKHQSSGNVHSPTLLASFWPTLMVSNYLTPLLAFKLLVSQGLEGQQSSLFTDVS